MITPREYPKAYKTELLTNDELNNQDNIILIKIISNIIDNPPLIVLDFTLIKYGNSFIDMLHPLIQEVAKDKILIIVGGGKVIDSLATDKIILQETSSISKDYQRRGGKS